MDRRSILAAYKKKSSHLQTGVTGFKSGNLFNYLFPIKVKKGIPNRRCLISDWVCPLYFYISCIVFL